MTMSCNCNDKPSIPNTDKDWGAYMIKVGLIILLWVVVFCYGYTYFHPEENPQPQQLETVTNQCNK